MNINRLYLNFFETSFLLCLILFFLRSLKLTLFLNLNLYSLVLLLLFLSFVLVESTKNRKYLYREFKTIVKKNRDSIRIRTEEIQSKIFGALPIVKIFGKKFIFLISSFISFTIEFILTFKYFLLGLFVLFVFLEIFILPSYTDIIYFISIIIWIIIIYSFRLKSEVSIKGSLFFLLLSIFLIITRSDLKAEKVGNWAYIFLSVGVLQNVFIFWGKNHKT